MLGDRIARTSPLRLKLRPAALALCFVLALLAGGCAHRFPSEQVPKTKWLILPFNQPPTMAGNTSTVHGWWLTAKTIRQNERAGEMLADNLTRQMAHLEYLNLFSAIDLKYYFANKARRLKEYYKKQENRELTDSETAQLMAQVPKVEFAKDLGADKLLCGRINRQYMSENRTFHWWWAVLDVDVEVTDVATGKVEWSRHYILRQQLSSMMGVQEGLAEQLIGDLEQEYFLPLAKK